MAAVDRGAVSKSSRDGSGKDSSPVHSWRLAAPTARQRRPDDRRGERRTARERSRRFSSKLGVLNWEFEKERESRVDGNEKKGVLGLF